MQSTCGRCEWCSRRRTQFCLGQLATGVDLLGGHAEFMHIYTDARIRIPDGVSYGQGLHGVARPLLGEAEST
jgi:D-arabinose 1-dehydrogenase-like Zn-dependent alcohol dehydrogenase